MQSKPVKGVESVSHFFICPSLIVCIEEQTVRTKYLHCCALVFEATGKLRFTYRSSIDNR